MKSKFIAALFLFAIVGWVLPGCSKSPSGTKATSAKTLYQCPMHPQIIQDKPGECPICFMKLVPVKSPDAAPAAGAEDPAAHDRAAVTITPEQQQLIGVTTVAIARAPLQSTIRASARVAYDPDLYSAILEHQQTVRTLAQTPVDSPWRKEQEQTARASRMRLKQMGLSDDQIHRASHPDMDPSNLLLSREGEGVWVYADLYDYEAPMVRPGQKADLSAPALSGRVLTGTVRSIDTVLNAQTRTLRARLWVPEGGGVLKPETFLTARIHALAPETLVIPKTAVLSTGERWLAYVEVKPGHLEPRDIRLGREGDTHYEILEGLQEGDKVVSSANFLIDSESKIKAAVQGATHAH